MAVQGRELVVQLVHELRKELPKLGGRKLYHLLAPRMAELQVTMGRDQFFEVLRQERLLIRRRNRRVRTTLSKHGMAVYPDL